MKKPGKNSVIECPRPTSATVAQNLPGGHRGSPGREPFGVLWPHGEFSCGWRAKGQQRDELNDNETVTGWALCEPGTLIKNGVVRGEALLTLPHVPNSIIPASRPETYGRRGLTRHGAKMIRAGCHLMTEAHGRENLSFLTLTLPPLDKPDLEKLATGWARVQNAFLVWLSRKLAIAGIPAEYIAAIELQPGRASGGDPGSIHAHIIFPGRVNRYRRWAVSRSDCREAWGRILGHALGQTVDLVLYPYLRPVKSSAGAYIAKYLSKGSETALDVAELSGWACIPRQWWSCSRALSRRIRRATCRGVSVGTWLDGLVSAYLSGASSEFPGRLYPVLIEFDGLEVVVGYAGRLHDTEAAELRAILSAVAVSSGRQ